MRRFDVDDSGRLCIAMSDCSDGDMGMEGDGAERRLAFRTALGLGERPLVLGRQIHGISVCLVDTLEEKCSLIANTDGLYTIRKEDVIGVFVADCVPLWIWGEGVVAIVHAGREGTFRGIASEAVKQIRQHEGLQQARLHAMIGPSAGPCCYEVSEEIAGNWRDADQPVEGRHLDLWEANRAQLVAAGVGQEDILVAGACTICSERYHSYRRTGTKSRNMAVAALL